MLGIYHWLKDCLCHHRIRILVGFVLFWVELALFLGTGVMLEDVTNFHSGEGSWEEAQGDGSNVFCQEFVPQYDNLQRVGFLMYKENVTIQDGIVTLLVTDKQERVLCEKSLSFDEVIDGSFTDVEMGLKLSSGYAYYLSVVTTPSSAGEYPTMGVCSKPYSLPENRVLVHGEEMEDTQLVGRYYYQGVIPFSKVCKIVLLCLITALGVMFGLPDNSVLRRVVGILLLVAVPCVLGSRLEMLTYRDVFYLPMVLKWNIGLMFLLELVVLLCTHSPGVSMVLTNTVLTIVYSANYFMVMYRGTSLRVNDLSAIGTVVDIVDNYRFVPNDHLAFAWGLLFMFVVYGIQTVNFGLRKHQNGTKESRKDLGRRALTYVVTIAVGVGLLVYSGHKLLYTDYLDQKGFANEDFRFEYELIYSFDGYLIATCIDVKNSRVTEPEGYSVEYAEQILTDAAGNGRNDSSALLSHEEFPQEELPHVIMIMNESFADLRILGDLGLNQENMPFLNSMRENTVRGYVNASVIGGGTANSEFEVFTGCSVAFFPVNYYPYQQGLKKPVNSLVSQMERYGYTTYSMHPKNAVNWNRTRIYQYYGFDNSLWESDFKGAEVLHSGVSDAETYQKVIELFEGREAGERQFIFDLTIQNHGDYPGEQGPYEIQSAKMNNPSVDEYLTLIKRSDEAFADLIRYFEGQDEKVLVCMFGDHQPWLSSLITGMDQAGVGQDGAQVMNMYKTPFVIWANYDIEEADGYDISMNYLGGLLQRTAGIPLSPYFEFLERLRGDYPVITLNGYVDKEGNYSNWGSGENEFLEYRILQYNYLFDDHSVEWGY